MPNIINIISILTASYSCGIFFHINYISSAILSSLSRKLYCPTVDANLKGCKTCGSRHGYTLPNTLLKAFTRFYPYFSCPAVDANFACRSLRCRARSNHQGKTERVLAGCVWSVSPYVTPTAIAYLKLFVLLDRKGHFIPCPPHRRLPWQS